MASLVSKAVDWLKIQKPERVFLAISLTVGILFVFLTPPIAVVDEENHFFRAYELSQANLFTDRLNNGGAYGANIPENMAYFVYYNKGKAIGVGAPSDSSIWKVAKEKPNESITREVVYNGSAAYSPIGYIPQAVGMFIAGASNMNNEGYLYIGRLLNLIAFIAIVFLSIRIIPVGKYILFSVALIPTTLYQSASLSIDAILVASVLLAIAASVHLLLIKKVKKRILLALLASLIAISLMKYIYMLLIIPILVYWVFRVDRSERLRSFALVFLLIILPLAALYLWNSSLPGDVLTPASVLDAGTKEISVSKQLAFILNNPLAYTSSVINLLFFDAVSADVIWRGMIGRFGWMGGNYFAPLLSMVLGILSLALAMLIDKTRFKKSVHSKSIKPGFTMSASFMMAAALTALGVITGLYVAFTSVGSSKILGVQGRYFIPIIPVFLLSLVFLKGSIVKLSNHMSGVALLYGMVIANLIYASLVIIKQFY